MTNFEDFALNVLPVPPCRVLEVGAGNGQLARALHRAGYDVLAIDPAPEYFEAVAQVAIEDVDLSVGRFSAVVANRSLHHVRDVEMGLDRIVALLTSDGTLILQDFAWDRVDGSTGAWLCPERLSPPSRSALSRSITDSCSLVDSISMHVISPPPAHVSSSGQSDSLAKWASRRR